MLKPLVTLVFARTSEDPDESHALALRVQKRHIRSLVAEGYLQCTQGLSTEMLKGLERLVNQGALDRAGYLLRQTTCPETLMVRRFPESFELIHEAHDDPEVEKVHLFKWLPQPIHSRPSKPGRRMLSWNELLDTDRPFLQLYRRFPDPIV